MVMKLNTGVPGSGKTYLMVSDFIKNFCTWEKETGRYLLKEEYKSHVLISNIEGLGLEHLDLETLMAARCLTLAKKKYLESPGDEKVSDFDDVIDDYYYEFLDEKVRWFFNYPYQKQLQGQYKDRPLIYLIEESQRYFDGKELGRQKWVRDTFLFFEKSRHLGVSIYMDTQHVSKIVKGISCLFETEIKAKPRTFSIGGEFKYNEYSDGQKVNQIPIVVKPDKRIFNTYKSMHSLEALKTKRPVLRILLFLLVMGGVSFGVLNYAISNLGGGVKSVTAAETSKSEGVSPGAVKTYLKSPVKPVPGQWVRLTSVFSSDGITVVHPVTNVLLLFKEMDLKCKEQGGSLFAFVPDSQDLFFK